MTQALFIDVQDIRIGMFIQLDIGWLRHPFPVSSFRISSTDQIQALQNLGVECIRCIPAKCDAEITEYLLSVSNSDVPFFVSAPSPVAVQDDFVEVPEFSDTQQGLMGFGAAASEGCSDSALLDVCDQRFSAATQRYRQVIEELQRSPGQAMQTGCDLVSSYIAELLDAPHTAIRLLSESAGEQQGAHSINVTLLSLMLGKSYGLTAVQLLDMGLAALLHDIGKMDLDARCLESLPTLTQIQSAEYEKHVGASVAYAQAMGLSPSALTAIAQHHEFADGTGFPLGLLKEDLSLEGQILALTNCYDKLCNPSTQMTAMTPHEALSTLFVQRRGAFAREMVELFVRVMGVYPPGSVVQLSDDRYGLVVAVQSSHPLKPTVLLHDREVARAQAMPVELAELKDIVIKRSLRPAQLPRDVLDYLSPRKRVCYFFERAVPLSPMRGEV